MLKNKDVRSPGLPGVVRYLRDEDGLYDGVSLDNSEIGECIARFSSLDINSDHLNALTHKGLSSIYIDKCSCLAIGDQASDPHFKHRMMLKKLNIIFKRQSPSG